MRLANCISALLVGLAALAAQPAAAVTWVTNSSGVLLRANGVVVNGMSYDVRFLDGTCASLFSGCDATTDFPFQTLGAAQAAGQALLDQVLLNPFPSPGNFDSEPDLTRGCANNAGTCRIYIPYEVLTTGSPRPWKTVVVKNTPTIDNDVVTYSTGIGVEDTTSAEAKTFAIFVPPGGGGTDDENGGGAVPEPSTWAMMLMGFFLTGAAMRRSSRGQASRQAIA